MIRLLILAVSVLLFSFAYADGKGADRGSPQAEFKDKQQHKRAIERHADQTGVREPRRRAKDADDAVDEADEEKDSSPEDKKPQ